MNKLELGQKIRALRKERKQTQEKLTESAKNQDELLRILIVNSLGDELEKDIAEPKAKSGRKQ